MERKRKEIDEDTIGVVAFARGECPDWVVSILKLN